MSKTSLFEALNKINQKPKLYQYYTALELWNDPYVSEKMLEMHLSENNDVASKNKKMVEETVNWINERFNIKNKSLCDFGCGPGLYTTRFAEKGAQVTGIDFSERSIHHAKQTAANKNLNIEYVLKNYLEFEPNKKFDLITMICFDFCALSIDQRKALLKKFHCLLNLDGFVVLDVLSTNVFDKIDEKASYDHSSDKDFWSNFWSESPYYVFSNTFKYVEEKVALDKFAIFEKNREREIFNWMQYYTLESLKKEFQENGFEVTEHYSNIAGKPYQSDSAEIAVVARKLK